MGQQLATISAGFNDLPTNIARALPSAGTTPPAAPGSSASTVVVQVKPLPQLDRKDYENVVHWDRGMYKRLRKMSKKDERPEEEDGDEPEEGDPQIEARAAAMRSKLTAKKIRITSCYMEDENGEQMPELQKTAARSRARGFWTKVSRNGGTPPASLGKADSDVRDSFVAYMEEGFPWLRFCENHWKSEQIWINHYGSWLTAFKNPARGAVVKAEDDADDEGDEDGQKKAPKRPQEGGETSKSKRPRVDEKEPTPPPPPGPAPTKITTERMRVCLFILIDLMLS